MKAVVVGSLIAVAGLSFPERTDAQQQNGGSADTTVVVTAGRKYAASSTWRFLFGSTWRDAWTTPVEAPVLDLARYANGLTPFKQGGNQSMTLHLRGGDGRRYVFRTVAKQIPARYRGDLRGTPLGDIVQDQQSATHPAGGLIADKLEHAAGILHAEPRLVVMPDDERLGEYRKAFAGQLGYIEIKPDDATDGKAFANATKIRSSDGLLDELDESLSNRLDARAWLKARLFDAIIGDFDRGADNWDWACYDEGSVQTCKPIARDRDWAFMHANGFMMRGVRSVFPRLGSFDRSGDNLRRVTDMTYDFDRSHLVVLSHSAWDSVVAELRANITDSVIDEALRAQPESYVDLEASRLIALGIRARRDDLDQLVKAFYTRVNTYPDLFAADDDNRVEIDRLPGGSVRVRIGARAEKGSGFGPHGAIVDRTFSPKETKEVRVYLQGGDDEAIVRGKSFSGMIVRVVGGGGDDVLMDSSHVTLPGTYTKFYDAKGHNKFVKAGDTAVDTRKYVTAQPGTLDPRDKDKPEKPRDVEEERRGRFRDQWVPVVKIIRPNTAALPRNWGTKTAFRPGLDFRQSAGPLISGALTRTHFGFRRDPYEWRAKAKLTYAPLAPGFGALLEAEWRPLNSSRFVIASVDGSQFEAMRFFGYGNTTELLPDSDAKFMRDEVLARVMAGWQLNDHMHFALGPVARYVKHELPTNALLAPGAAERAPYKAIGGTAHAEVAYVDDLFLEHKGVRANVDVTQYGHALDAASAYGRVQGEIAGYIPIGAPTLALRATGQRVWGDFPVHEAALIGGRHTLRGYVFDRFAGDAAVTGSAELRVPLFRVKLFTSGRLGLIALADAGRVWNDGESLGSWHTAVGGGLSFTTVSRVFSASYAHGEVDRVYLRLGFPF